MALGSGLAVPIFGDKDSDDFFLVLRICKPIRGANHSARETHEHIFVGMLAHSRRVAPKVPLHNAAT